MQITESTKALAQQILDYWTYTGKQNQLVWIDQDDELEFNSVVLSNGKEMTVCNSTMCAAGTAVFLTTDNKTFKEKVENYDYDDEFWENTAGRLLGLNNIERDKLFYSDDASAVDLMTAVAQGDQKKFDEIEAGRI